MRVLCLAVLAFCASAHADVAGSGSGPVTGPIFIKGEDPKPEGQKWSRVEALSDEFDGEELDLTKWQKDPKGNTWSWLGRPPALFTQDNVVVKDGRLSITVGKLDEPVQIQQYGKQDQYTHYGAIVRSLQPGQPGWYYECKMKANQTVMSSTFWLMTKHGTEKKLELDIQECVGQISPKADSWASKFDRIFHSNMIHRVNKNNPEATQIQGQVLTETKNWERFYVYGAWWKSPEEVRFYLDGKYVYSINPSIAFDVPSYIQMAIETYDWNPIPDDGGLVESGTKEQRTTDYEWVRVWKLE